MTPERERTIASLSLAALAVDLLVTMLVISGLVTLADASLNFWQYGIPKLWVQISAVPIAMILHLALVEFVFGGQSIGRLCIGLTVVNPASSGWPSLSQRIKRFASIMISFGMRSLSFKRLPRYNNCEDCRLESDWVGAATPLTGSNPRKSASMSVSQDRPGSTSGEMRVTVTRGPNAGASTVLSSAIGKDSKGIFVIGRDTKRAHLSLFDDAGVSRIHCRIARKGSQYLIIDGSSKGNPSAHGTSVNGVKVSAERPSAISPGAIIKVGHSEILFTA